MERSKRPPTVLRENITEKIEKNPVVPLKTIYENQVQETDEKFLPPAFSPVRRAMIRTREKKIFTTIQGFEFLVRSKIFWGMERSKRPPTILTD